jgi:hypothetical protein
MADRAAPLHFVKTASGFVPKSQAARDFHAKTKLGQAVVLKGRRPRNPQHHRKMFALLSLVRDNSEQFQSTEDVLIAVKAATGRGRWVMLPGATKEIFIPDSIAFDAMSQDEFEPFYEAAVAAVRRWWLPVNDDELREAVEAFAA